MVSFARKKEKFDRAVLADTAIENFSHLTQQKEPDKFFGGA